MELTALEKKTTDSTVLAARHLILQNDAHTKQTDRQTFPQTVLCFIFYKEPAQYFLPLVRRSHQVLKINYIVVGHIVSDEPRMLKLT